VSFSTSSSDLIERDAPAGARGERSGSECGRYLLVAGLVLVLGFAAAWIWSARMKLAFLDPEYAAWTAKQQLVASCDLGDNLVVGDSRAGAGFLPAALPGSGANIAVGGAKPVELYFLLHRALSCQRLPRRILMSIDARHFDSVDTFWTRSARFGTFSTADLRLVGEVARQTGDRSLFAADGSRIFPAPVREWLYAHSFPTLNFASMLRAGIGLRWWRNEREVRLTLAARGQHLFGDAPGNDDIADEGRLDRFSILPLEKVFFERMLQDAQSRGVPVYFVTTPVNQATAAHMSQHLVDGFREFLRGLQDRYSGFHVLVAPVPALPDRFFGDYFNHLNAAGARLFTTTVREALQQRLGEAAAAR